jgi:L-cysteine desulfidase
MSKCGESFQPGDGIVSDNIEDTIRNFGIVGRDGMHETDISIMKLMINC